MKSQGKGSIRSCRRGRALRPRSRSSTSWASRRPGSSRASPARASAASGARLLRCARIVYGTPIVGGTMSKFHLHEVLIYWFNALAKHTSNDLAVFVFAITGGHFVRESGRIGWRLRPFVWPRVRDAISESIEWQVKKVFRLLRRCTHTQKSTWWVVFCGLTVSISLGLAVKMQRWDFAILVALVCTGSVATSFCFACHHHEPRTTKSFRNAFRFTWSFFATIAGYCILAVLSAIGLVILDHL